MTALQKLRATIEDREATAEEEGKLRELAQTELAQKWRRAFEAHPKRGAA